MRRHRNPLNMERQGDSRGGLRALAFDQLALDDIDRPNQLAALDCTAQNSQVKFPRPADDRWIYFYSCQMLQVDISQPGTGQMWLGRSSLVAVRGDE